jgi:nucleoside-diphosphate-sugar epimerase
VAVVRQAGAAIEGGATVVVAGSLGAATDWSVLRAGDVVAHLAAHVHRMQPTDADTDAFREVNVKVTETLAHAAASARVHRLVFVSTAKVLGEADPGRPFRGSDPLVPGDPYSRSKADAEDVVRRSGVPFCIVRPPLVYGPEVRANFLRLIDAVWRGVPLPLASVANSRSLIGVGNLASAIAHCGESAAAAGQTFLVRDGDDLSTPELIRRIGNALGRAARLLPFPEALIRMAAAIAGRSAAADRLLGSFRLDDSAIRSLTGWRPPRSVDEELRSTAEWYLGTRGVKR